MGIETPEQFGGAAKALSPWLASLLKRSARVDGSVSVLCDVQNTLGDQRFP
jgi:hypothetical protein